MIDEKIAELTYYSVPNPPDFAPSYLKEFLDGSGFLQITLLAVEDYFGNLEVSDFRNLEFKNRLHNSEKKNTDTAFH
jgi:hypothetical protein